MFINFKCNHCGEIISRDSESKENIYSLPDRCPNCKTMFDDMYAINSFLQTLENLSRYQKNVSITTLMQTKPNETGTSFLHNRTLFTDLDKIASIYSLSNEYERKLIFNVIDMIYLTLNHGIDVKHLENIHKFLSRKYQDR